VKAFDEIGVQSLDGAGEVALDEGKAHDEVEVEVLLLLQC